MKIKVKKILLLYFNIFLYNIIMLKKNLLLLKKKIKITKPVPFFENEEKLIVINPEKKFDFVEKVVYINLDEAVERKNKVESELLKYFPSEKIIRFPAIKKEKGYLGCSLSHCEVIKMAIDNNWENILVIEDDMIWNNSIENSYKIFEKIVSNKFDVIQLNTFSDNFNSETFKLNKSTSTCSYFVKKHYYNKLYTNFYQGTDLLIKFIKKNNSKYRIDVHWQLLQKKDNWFCVVPSLCCQNIGYSYIENKYLNTIR